MVFVPSTSIRKLVFVGIASTMVPIQPASLGHRLAPSGDRRNRAPGFNSLSIIICPLQPVLDKPPDGFAAARPVGPTTVPIAKCPCRLYPGMPTDGAVTAARLLVILINPSHTGESIAGARSKI